VTGKRALIPLGTRPLKGYDGELPVFGMSFDERPYAA
jgi:adenylate cyclase